ncbi:MAG: ParB/RepB/Spo0J family partition protein [Actinomycetota bacterium]|nr:ParB/RepB/Spo0J family partition protein [Actinomycetota bacterium]
MAARKSGLGRGLDALIPVDHPSVGFAELELEEISPNPQQPRSRFDDDALGEMAASISEVGVLQPVVVRPGDADGTYVLIAGERRLRAAAMAGLATIPAVIRASESDERDLTEALIENIQRKDLSPLEEAAAYRNLLEDFGMTHEQVATRVAKSRSAVTNTLRLLQLPAQIQGMLEREELSAGHARALLSLDDEAYAVHIAERVVAEGWPVRKVEEAVKKRSVPGVERGRGLPTMRPAAIIELEERLSERLATKVKITTSGAGGRMVIRYGSLEDLERIYRQLFD